MVPSVIFGGADMAARVQIMKWEFLRGQKEWRRTYLQKGYRIWFHISSEGISKCFPPTVSVMDQETGDRTCYTGETYSSRSLRSSIPVFFRHSQRFTQGTEN